MAEWPLPFPGNPNDQRGFVRILTAQMEDGQTYSNILQTHPRWAAGGAIEGRYQLTLPENSVFEATVGFIQGATGSDGVIFEVIWREKGRGEILLRTHEEKYDGRLNSFIINLNEYAGHSGTLVLRVKAGLSAGQDWAAWKVARITAAPARAAALPPEKEKPRPALPPAKITKPIPPVKQIPIGRIEEAANRISCYNLKVERSPLGFQCDGIVDEESQSLYFRISLVRGQENEAEFYQIGTKGYGRPVGSQAWLNVKVGEQFPRYLKGIVELLNQGKIASTREEEQLLKYEIQIDNIPPRDNPEQFFRSLFKQPKTAKQERMMNRMIETSQGLKVATHI
jgi:hypothetical protein